MRLPSVTRPCLWLLWCILFWAAPALAGDILKMETETTVESTADRIAVRVVVANRGTAPAYDVQAHMTALGLSKASPVTAQLDPGQSEEAFFERELRGFGKGRYPMTVRVDFHDANQYPFSALSGMTFHIGEAVNPELAVRTRDMTLRGSGTMRFDVKNLGQRPERVTAVLVLPKEFSSPRPQTVFEIDPRSERKVEFAIHNFSALGGASYPVFCYFEYDSDGIHHTALARSLITVVHDESVFRRFRWAWMTLAGVLGLLLVAVLIRDRRKKSSPN